MISGSIITGPLSGNELEAFSRDEYGFYLVTRLTGYDVDTH